MAVKDTPPSPRTPSGARRPDPQVEAPTMSIEGIRRGCLGSAASKVVLGLLLLVFAGGVVFTGLGSNGFSGINGTGDLNGSGTTGSTTSSETAATINGATVTEGQLNQALDNQLKSFEQYGFPIETSQLLYYRQNALQGLAGRLALQQDANKQGFNPSSDDTEKAIAKQIDDDIKAAEGKNPTAFRRQIEASGKTLASIRTDALQNADRDAAAQKWAIDKLEAKVKAGVKVTDADYLSSQTKLNVQQIVIQPKLAVPETPAVPAAKGVKAQPAKPAQPAETPEQARARAESVLKQLGANPTAAQFAALAKTASDDNYTKAQGGSLNPPAAKGGKPELKLPNQLGLPTAVSDELLSGANESKNLVGPLQDPATKYLYILHILERQPALPKDYNKKKAEYLKTYQQTRADSAWQEYQTKINQEVESKLAVVDPAVLAFKAQSQLSPSLVGSAATKARDAIIANYEAAREGASSRYAAAISSQLAQLYTSNGQPAEAVQALTEATKQDPQNVETQLALVRALQNNKQTGEALTKLTQASQSLDRNPPQPPAFSMSGSAPDPSVQLRTEIASLYDQLGKKALALEERGKIKPPSPAGAPGGAGSIPGLPPGAILGR